MIVLHAHNRFNGYWLRRMFTSPTETVLVIGGCCFIGCHILKTLRKKEPAWALHAASRTPSRNQIQDVEYHACNIASYEQVQELLRGVSPTVIIHAASPSAVGDRASETGCFRTNVDGTRCLLDCAIAHGSTKAFVYTSSCLAVEGAAHHMSTESTTVLRSVSNSCDPYFKSKALAERMVLGANSKASMLTTALRLPSTYGEGDEQTIGEGIKAFWRGDHKFQIGDNSNLCDWVSVSNAAQAHLLAVRALLAEHEGASPSSDIASRPVGGEALFITDGEPLPFWDHFRIIWKAAGDRTPQNDVVVFPSWLAMSFAAVVETLYYVFTLGTKKPKALRRELLELTFFERTFCIEKARQTLGYEPAHDRDKQMLKGVRWYLEQCPA